MAPGQLRGSATAGADLDAYRRHRGTCPNAEQTALIAHLDAVKGSTQPQVMLPRLASPRLADAVATSFADGCQVEPHDGVEPPLSVLARRDQSSPDYSPDQAALVEGPLLNPSRGGYPSYAGILTLWWEGRVATESDRVAAELLVRHVTGLVDRQRLMDRAGASETPSGRCTDGGHSLQAGQSRGRHHDGPQQLLCR